MTGELFPDVTGIYEDVGELNGKRLYLGSNEIHFIWWDGVNEWVIGEPPGIKAVEWWARVDPNIEGQYEPHELADGIATVTEI